MKRDEALLKLRAARKELQQVLAGVPDQDRVRLKAVGEWSVKDVLGHIAAWDEECLRVIQAFAMQTEPQYAYTISEHNDFGAWNSEQIALRKERPLAAVKQEFDNARRDLIQIVEGMTDQVLMRSKLTTWGKERTGLELLEDLAAHDLDHAAMLRRWRKKRERWARARKKYVSKRREAKKSNG